MKQVLFLFSILIFGIQCNAQLFINDVDVKDIYHKDWIDLNKNGVKDVYEDSKANIDYRIENLISLMSIEEKTNQMATLYGYRRVCEDALPTENWKSGFLKDGIGNIDEHLNSVAFNEYARTEYSWPPSNHAKAINEVQRFFIEDTRLGIPVDFTNEGIRGLCHEKCTGFPAQIGIGATWNKELVYQIGRITAEEGKALGYTNIYAPILDVASDPRWGRTVECYSEDPFLVSTYGLEMINAIQDQGVAATAKHFAVYSIPKGGRDGEVRTDPQISNRTMHEVYLEPFRRAVTEAKVMGVMSSYNDYDGVPISGSEYFLIDLLRKQWGFDGYVVSDSWAVGGLEGRHFVTENFKESTFRSVMAGLNVRTNFSPPQDFVLPLRELIQEGRIPMEIIDSRVSDILRVKFELGLFDNPYNQKPAEADELVANEENIKIAKQTALESIVLLKNEEQILPIEKNKFKRILICGPNAKDISHSESRYGPSWLHFETVYEGIKNYVSDDTEVVYAQGCDFFDENWPLNELYDIEPDAKQQNMINEAVSLAQNADLIIVAVGDNEETVGESKSRTSLNLPGNQLDLLKALHKTGKPMVGILINGRPMSINWMDKYVPAIIEAWCPGPYGGSTLAKVIFGEYNPGGKLTVTFPKTVGQIPFNFPHKRSSQKEQDKPDKDYIGRTRINHALYPFGYGLSYTSFGYSNLIVKANKLTTDFDSIEVSCTIKNTGNYDGDEVIQLYIKDEYSSVVSYEKLLRGFSRVHLKKGEEKKIRFMLTRKDFEILNENMERVVEKGSFKIMIGSSSEEIQLEETITLN